MVERLENLKIEIFSNSTFHLLAAEALVYDVFFQARVGAKFFDGNELMLLLFKVKFNFS